MIIIDDASPDNSNEIIGAYCKQDSRIKLLKMGGNSGPANARNKGIKNSKGRYISFLDSDDTWFPEKLEKQVKFMQENNLYITCSSYYTIDEDGNSINTRIVKKSFSYVDLLKSNQIGNLTGIYDSSKLGKLYMKNVDHEDYVLWLEIMEKVGNTKAIIEPLAEYRILNDSLSGNKIKSVKWTWNIYRKTLDFNLLKSSYYFVHYAYNAVKKRV